MKKIVLLLVILVMALISGCGLLSNKTKLDINELVEIEVLGYAGYSNASARVSIDYVYDEFAISHSSKSKNYLQDLAKIDQAIKSINVELSEEKNLFNGDEIIATISYDSDKFKEAKMSISGKEIHYVVENLPEVKNVDPFDYMDVQFEGISPLGRVKMEVTPNDFVSKYSFKLSSDSNLKNGDTVLISYKDDNDPARSGYVLTVKEKEYEVIGLDEYLEDISDISDSDFNTLKGNLKDTVIAYRASNYKNTVSYTEPEYVGIVIYGEGKATAFYKATISSQDNSFSQRVIFYPISCEELIMKDNKLSSCNIGGVIGESISLKGAEYSKGYLDPYYMYTSMVEAKRNDICYEDQTIKAYAERPVINSISDIPESYIEELLVDSKEVVESHVLQGQEKIEAMDYMGYYCLLAKNQGNDVSQNNKLYFVYKVILTDKSRFADKEKYTVYYLSSYSGIMLIDGNYSYIERKTDIGKKSLRYGRYCYESIEDAYTDIVLKNSDKYTSEVSDSLKE